VIGLDVALLIGTSSCTCFAPRKRTPQALLDLLSVRHS
jgi:hypothetical protein